MLIDPTHEVHCFGGVRMLFRGLEGLFVGRGGFGGDFVAMGIVLLFVKLLRPALRILVTFLFMEG